MAAISTTPAQAACHPASHQRRLSATCELNMTKYYYYSCARKSPGPNMRVENESPVKNGPSFPGATDNEPAAAQREQSSVRSQPYGTSKRATNHNRDRRARLHHSYHLDGDDHEGTVKRGTQDAVPRSEPPQEKSSYSRTKKASYSSDYISLNSTSVISSASTTNTSSSRTSPASARLCQLVSPAEVQQETARGVPPARSKSQMILASSAQSIQATFGLSPRNTNCDTIHVDASPQKITRILRDTPPGYETLCDAPSYSSNLPSSVHATHTANSHTFHLHTSGAQPAACKPPSIEERLKRLFSTQDARQKADTSQVGSPGVLAISKAQDLPPSATQRLACKQTSYLAANATSRDYHLGPPAFDYAPQDADHSSATERRRVALPANSGGGGGGPPSRPPPSLEFAARRCHVAAPMANQQNYHFLRAPPPPPPLGYTDGLATSARRVRSPGDELAVFMLASRRAATLTNSQADKEARILKWLHECHRASLD